MQVAKDAGYLLVLSEIPSRSCVGSDSYTCDFNHERIRWLSERHAVPFHAAHLAFDGVSDNLAHYWAENDGHFNQNGSDLYAKSLFDFLVPLLD